MKYLTIIIMIAAFDLWGQPHVDHSGFTNVLQRHVDSDGWVDYSGLAKNPAGLNEYLDQLRSNPPIAQWSREEKLAYWINAYNAFTLHLIIVKYPVESIKDIGSWFQIPFVNTPWDIKFIEIADEVYDLNNIEHDILRKDFDEPRIHFAIVCASYSCPRLSPRAFEAATLEQQLDDAAKDFLNDPRKNVISATEPRVSKIFSWFGGDFKKKTTLREYLNQYSEVEIKEDADIEFLEYDWRLNDQKTLP